MDPCPYQFLDQSGRKWGCGREADDRGGMVQVGEAMVQVAHHTAFHDEKGQMRLGRPEADSPLPPMIPEGDAAAQALLHARCGGQDPRPQIGQGTCVIGRNGCQIGIDGTRLSSRSLRLGWVLRRSCCRHGRPRSRFPSFCQNGCATTRNANRCRPHAGCRRSAHLPPRPPHS